MVACKTGKIGKPKKVKAYQIIISTTTYYLKWDQALNCFKTGQF